MSSPGGGLPHPESCGEDSAFGTGGRGLCGGGGGGRRAADRGLEEARPQLAGGQAADARRLRGAGVAVEQRDLVRLDARDRAQQPDCDGVGPAVVGAEARRDRQRVAVELDHLRRRAGDDAQRQDRLDRPAARAGVERLGRGHRRDGRLVIVLVFILVVADVEGVEQREVVGRRRPGTLQRPRRQRRGRRRVVAAGGLVHQPLQLLVGQPADPVARLVDAADLLLARRDRLVVHRHGIPLGRPHRLPEDAVKDHERVRRRAAAEQAGDVAEPGHRQENDDLQDQEPFEDSRPPVKGKCAQHHASLPFPTGHVS